MDRFWLLLAVIPFLPVSFPAPPPVGVFTPIGHGGVPQIPAIQRRTASLISQTRPLKLVSFRV